MFCTFDEWSIMNGARVIDGKICYHVSLYKSIKNLYKNRYDLYKNYYNHWLTQSYECLFVDILKAIDG